MGTWRWAGDVLLGPTGLRLLTGSGDPEGSVTANVGSMYLRTDGASGQSVYLKESGAGNTGWAGIMTGGTPSLSIQVGGIPISVQSILNLTSTGLIITDEGSGTVHLDVAVTDIPYSNSKGVITTVGQALDAVLPLSIPSITNTIALAEVGTHISSVDVNWTLSDAVSDLRFTAVPTGLTPAAPAVVSPTTVTSQTFLGSYTSASATSITWTLQATKGSQIVTANTSIAFQLKNYYGVSSSATLTSSQVLALGTSQFATSRVLSGVVYNCAGGKYPYFCYPQVYGDPMVTVDGIQCTDWTKAVVLVTNAAGFTTNYNVIRLTNIQSGVLTISRT